MWDSISKRLRRVAYWQWAMLGCLPVLFAWVLWIGWRGDESEAAANLESQGVDLSVVELIPTAILHRLPPWIRSRWAWYRVVHIRLVHSQSSDPDILRELHRLPALKTLHVYGSGTNSQTPSRQFSETPEPLLETLANLTQLQNLGIMNCDIPRDGMRRLSKLTHLRVLLLSGASVNDSDLETMNSHKSLRILDLEGTNVCGSGLRYLGELQDLERLDLSRSPFADEFVPLLLNLRKLRKLGLENTKITDASVPDLSQLQSIRQLRVSGLSEYAISQLRLALPNCEVYQAPLRDD